MDDALSPSTLLSALLLSSVVGKAVTNLMPNNFLQLWVRWKERETDRQRETGRAERWRQQSVERKVESETKGRGRQRHYNEDRPSRIFKQWNTFHISHNISFLPSGLRFHPGRTDWQTIFQQRCFASPATATVNLSLDDCHKFSANPHIFLSYLWWQIMIFAEVNVFVYLSIVY